MRVGSEKRRVREEGGEEEGGEEEGGEEEGGRGGGGRGRGEECFYQYFYISVDY